MQVVHLDNKPIGGKKLKGVDTYTFINASGAVNKNEILDGIRNKSSDPTNRALIICSNAEKVSNVLNDMDFSSKCPTVILFETVDLKYSVKSDIRGIQKAINIIPSQYPICNPVKGNYVSLTQFIKKNQPIEQLNRLCSTMMSLMTGSR